MKKQTQIYCLLLLLFLLEAAVLVRYAAGRPDVSQDAVTVNRILQAVTKDWGSLDRHQNQEEAEYVVLDHENNVCYRTRSGLSETLHDAVTHRDTILTVEREGVIAGRILVYNQTEGRLQEQKQATSGILAGALLLQCVSCGLYLWYLNRALVKPFEQLRGFAGRIAQGNLDIPLEMDRQNLFGAFTESFDIMRGELKKARIAEAEANAAKKELIAGLSHDIRTPVASIKAAAEVGCALAADGRLQENYIQIIRKADQINTLITNLFTAALRELSHLTVNPTDMDSREIRTLLENADYLHLAAVPDIPECLLLADRLRLQQVFDNIFANSYKYAGTAIQITVRQACGCLLVCMKDYGGGVPEQELALLKEKYRRGGNAAGIEGAGLGLYISDQFMKEMQGDILLENAEDGFQVTVQIACSGSVFL